MQPGPEPPPSRPRRRGCIWALALAGVLVAVTGVLGAMALAKPDLGPPPAGRNDGDTQAAIVTSLATSLGAQLLIQSHGVIALSEHDLTVLVRENNPSPTRFQNPNARIRNGLVVIDARTVVGPFTVQAVARMGLSRTVGADELPQVSAAFTSLQVGGLGLPDFAARALQDRVQQAFDLQDVLGTNPYLRLARSSLDCVAVSSGEVRLGFHRPGASTDAATCA
jgi:hypothetical protein